jgi:hypothetical protein
MFFIVPKTPEDLMEAMKLLSNYHVAAESYLDNADNLYLSIIHDHYESEDDDVRLAEMAFQMNWHQGGECPECTEQPCGCMVFTKPIKFAF